MEFGKTSDNLINFIGSDYVKDLDRRRLLSSYVFYISSYTISWKTTLQLVMALSTMKVEYMAVTEAIKEALWLKGLFGEFSLHQGITAIHCDSQSAIHLIKN